MALPMLGIASMLAPLLGQLTGGGGGTPSGGGGGLPWKDIIGGLFGLGGAGMAGIGASAEHKRRWGDFEKRMGMIKPKTPYYGVEQGLSQIDPIVQKVVMGMLGQRGISMGNLGITPEMMAGVGQQGAQQRPRTQYVESAPRGARRV